MDLRRITVYRLETQCRCVWGMGSLSSGPLAWMAGDYVWFPMSHGAGRLTTMEGGLFVVSLGWCWVPPVHGAIYWVLDS